LSVARDMTPVKVVAAVDRLHDADEPLHSRNATTALHY